MRKPRDFDAELKALGDKARDLKSRKVQQLGELVIATGADTLTTDELAGAPRKSLQPGSQRAARSFIAACMELLIPIAVAITLGALVLAAGYGASGMVPAG